MLLFYKLLAPFETLFKNAVESFIHLETADDEMTFAAVDGSLVSVVKIDGSRQMIGEEEYNYLIEASTIKIGSRFDRPGHALQVYFARDPARIRNQVHKQVAPCRTTARNVGLDIDDLMDERISHLQNFLSYEEVYFVLWTRPSALTKSEQNRIAKEAKKVTWIPAGYAQNPISGLAALRARHKSFTSAIMSGLDELGVKSDMLEVHDALRIIKDNLFPAKAHDNWRANLPGDPIPPRAPQSRIDMSDIVWPKISSQIAVGKAQIINKSVVKMGDQLWAGADMTLAPIDPSPFPMLLNRLFEAKVPFRISFMIEGGGAQAVQFRSFMATLLSITNAVNRQIKFSLEGLVKLARSEPVVKLRISFATWAPQDDLNLVSERLSVLIQSVESWGYCQVSEVTGDPLACVMSSALGIHCGGTAPSAIAPMLEVMKLLPWQRPSSPFTQGALLLRSPDGKLWPYQTGTSLTTTWFDLIFAQPGAGKSVLMNSLNLATCLGAGLNQLPYIAIIDIGPSSSGLISLVKEALPAHRTHEAAYYRLQMSHQYAVNPFDTQLGCRVPLQDERSYLVELLTLLCTAPGQERPYDGIQQLCGLVVDEMYRWRTDNIGGAEPRPYLPRIDSEVDEALKEHRVHLPNDPYWWDVVDKMFEIGQYHIAYLAQRHAVPTLTDAITASRRPQIRTLLEETQIGGSAEGVINAFERMITSAIREFPILSSVTQFDVRDARVCALDLMDISPQGDETADYQTAIMYMLARHTLVHDWWIGHDVLKFIPEKYRTYHELRIQGLMESPKRLCYDEFHRTSKSGSVRGQLIRDVREGRKRGVQIVLASQLLDDFDENMVNLATGVWVLGTAVSDKAVDEVRDTFGLTQTARNVVRYRLTGPKSSGAPALLVLGTTEGRYEQHLINTLGPIELWALSTSSEDVTLRTKVYNRLGARRGRQMLAANFPGGSARSEIKKRVLAYSENFDSTTAATSSVIDEIVEEIVTASLKIMGRTPEDDAEDQA